VSKHLSPWQHSASPRGHGCQQSAEASDAEAPQNLNADDAGGGGRIGGMIVAGDSPPQGVSAKQ
jgi:hypothetical protein